MFCFLEQKISELNVVFLILQNKKQFFEKCKQTAQKILIYLCGGVKMWTMNMVFALAKGLKGRIFVYQ